MQRQLYYTLENASIESSDAESKLDKAGYPPIGEYLGGGGGFMVIKDKLVIDGSGYGEGSQTVVEDYETDAGHGHGGAAIGYVVKESDLFRLYPLIGFGGGGGGIVASQRAHGEKSMFNISGGSALLWLGLGFDLRLPLGERLRLVIGIRAGIHLPIGGDQNYRYKGPFFRWNLGMEWSSFN